MSTVIGSVSLYPYRIGKKESVCLIARAVTSTSNGVVDQALSTYSDNGFTVVSGGVGLYNVTFPICPADANISATLVTPLANTTNMLRVTAFAPLSGTATLAVVAATAPTTAVANANAVFEIHLKITGSKSSGN